MHVSQQTEEVCAFYNAQINIYIIHISNVWKLILLIQPKTHYFCAQTIYHNVTAKMAAGQTGLLKNGSARMSE